MNTTKQIVAVLFIAAGVLILTYRGFTYTRETHSADIPVIGKVSVQKMEHVVLPDWAGVAAVVVGGAPLLTPTQRRTA